MNRYLSPDDVCALVPGVTPTKLADLRDRGRGPRYFKPTARTVVYSERDVRAWVEASAVGTRDQPAARGHGLATSGLE